MKCMITRIDLTVVYPLFIFLDLRKANNKIDEEEFENIYDDFKLVQQKKKNKKINSRNNSRFDRKR